MHTSLSKPLKNPKFKKYRKLWGFSQKYKMFQYTTWGRKIFFYFQILFLTPFCNQKRHVRLFSPYYAQILTKKPKNQKIDENYYVFHNNTKNVLRYNLGSKKHFFIFRFSFWPFYTQILTKKSKIQKISKPMRFITKVQTTKCFNIQLRVDQYFLIFRFCFWHFL